MLKTFKQTLQREIKERSLLHLPSLPLSVEHTTTLCKLLQHKIKSRGCIHVTITIYQPYSTGCR